MKKSRVTMSMDPEEGVEELSIRERTYMDYSLRASRQLAWIAGRRAARRTVQDLLGPTFSPRQDTWDILPGVYGEPRVLGTPRAVYVSIAYGRGFAVAVADFVPVGADIEAPVRRTCPTQVGFLQPDELRRAWVPQEGKRSRLLAAYWTLKEAASKAVRMTIPPERFSVDLCRGAAIVCGGRHRFAGEVSLVGAYTLAVVRG